MFIWYQMTVGPTAASSAPPAALTTTAPPAALSSMLPPPAPLLPLTGFPPAVSRLHLLRGAHRRPYPLDHGRRHVKHPRSDVLVPDASLHGIARAACRLRRLRSFDVSSGPILLLCKMCCSHRATKFGGPVNHIGLLDIYRDRKISNSSIKRIGLYSLAGPLEANCLVPTSRTY
jgi:hypothetical protein